MSYDEQRWWSVGELARAARVTVRTLHYYDRLGLVTPHDRTAGGHRRYDEDDLARLLRVLSLRDLGFSLDELPALLDDTSQAPTAALLTTARAHRCRVEEQLQHHTRLRNRLDALIAALERGDAPHPDDMITTLEALAMTANLTRIYTRRGDDGRTDLADTSRVAKTDPGIEAIGAVDELNAVLGLAITAHDLPGRFTQWLRQVQNDLFDIGAQLADPAPADESTSSDDAADQPRIGQPNVTWLEHLCDQANADLPALRSFVLPGRTNAAAHLHFARTICRRAERRVLAAPQADQDTVRYLNRLSDLLFILSRAASTPANEVLWQPGQQPAVAELGAASGASGSRMDREEYEQPLSAFGWGEGPSSRHRPRQA